MFNLKLKSRKVSLEYTVAHRPRVTKRLHLELDESGGLVIVAPKHWSGALIKKTVAQNSSQISRFMARATRQQLPPLVYQHGASHLYLGEHLLLALRAHAAAEREPLIVDDELGLPASSSEPNVVKKALLRWYRLRATSLFSERMQLVAQRAPWAKDIDVPLSIRRMRRTWGNCSSSGKVKLNVHLIKAPLEIIDAVIAHELCHLKEMNHGKRFYKLLATLNPEWRIHRTILRANGYRFLQE